MVKEKIVDFVSKQTLDVVVPNPKGDGVKTVRRFGDVSSYFSADDMIEFDDSCESFINVNLSGSVLEVAEALKVTITKDGKVLNLKKAPFKVVKEVIGAVAGFFVYGE